MVRSRCLSLACKEMNWGFSVETGWLKGQPSENPEDQPTTGVFGRIGSWFSPWKGKSPKVSTENALPNSDQAVKLEGEEESEQSVTRQAREQQLEEEKEHRSNPNSLGLRRDTFLCEEEDATQSAHRDGFVVSSSEPGEGGPKEEEFVACRSRRIGQGKEREESGNGNLVSGNPENASHLTHLSSSSEQGVVWDSDQVHTKPQAQTQAQAQAGKRLHVYLEETSVIQSDKDTCVRQEVVRTKVNKSLQIPPKAKSSTSFESSYSLSLRSTENKKPNVRLPGGTQGCYSALAGVSLKSHKDLQSESEPDQEQTEADSMGRKNAARKKSKKNFQGDAGTSLQEKIPSNAHPASEGFPTSDDSMNSPQGESPTHMRESSVNSSSKHNPTFQDSPAGGNSKTSCPDTVKHSDNFQDSESVTLACVVDGGTDMEDDYDFYKVERKTETPESKRRSMKVSLSEVKFFTKNVPLKAEESPAGDDRDSKSALKSTKNEVKDKPKTEIHARLQDLEKLEEEPKPAVGRIGDKISLFERRAAGGLKQTFQSPRSADVSPVRKATERLKKDFELSDKRSKSAERYSTASSRSESPVGEKPMTIKERKRNFLKASLPAEKPALPQKPAMTGMSQKSSSSVTVAASKSPELESQGKRDTKEKTETMAMSEITLRPDGRDTAIVGVKISIPKEQHTVSKVKHTETSKTTDQGTKSDAKGTGDSAELTNNVSLPVKRRSRSGSRSKRRKSREPASPLSPNSQNEADQFSSKQELTAVKQQGDDTEETISASKDFTEKVSLPVDKAEGNTSDKQPVTDTKQQAFKTSKKDKLSNRQEGLPEPSVNKDEPDTAPSSRGTKTPIDKVPIILPQKEEKAGGDSLSFTKEGKNASKDSREIPSSSPSSSEQLVEKTPSVEKNPPVETPKTDKEFSMQSESKSKLKAGQPSKKDTGQTQQQQQQNNNTEPINQTEARDLEISPKTEKEKTNQSENQGNGEQQQLLPLNKNTTKGEVSQNVQGISGTEGSIVRDDQEKNAATKEGAQPVRGITKPEASQPEPASQSSNSRVGSSDLPAPTQHINQTVTKHPENTAVCAQAGTKSERGPSQGKKATNGPELQTTSTESPGTEKRPVVIAAEPQPNSVSVEKTENSADDSHTHGANDAEFSSSKPITKANTAVEEATLKVANDTPVLITAQTDNMAEKSSSVKEPTPISVSKSVSSEVSGQDDGNKSSVDKLVASKVKISSDKMKAGLSQAQCEETQTTASINDITSLKGSEKITHSSPGTVKKEPVNIKPKQILKELPSSKANKMSLDSIQHSMKRFNLPRGLSKDDSATRQDAPSSWLDLDFPKPKRKVLKPKLSSSGSESNLLDTSGELDDNDFVEKIKKLCAPFSLPPRKHNHLRPPQPAFAMPAIKEDHFEKTFDPEDFKFGLRKNNFVLDTASNLFDKLHNTEVKAGVRPVRASLADRSILLSSLDTNSRLKEKTSVKDEEDGKEEKDEQFKVRSRLERSCVFSGLTSSSIRGKKNGAESPKSENGSPTEAPLPSTPLLSQSPLPSPTDTTLLQNTLSKQSVAPSKREEAQAVEAVVSDSRPPLPSFDNIKLPDYLEKYLPREPVKPVQNIQGTEQVKTEVTGKMTTPVPVVEADLLVKPGLVLPDAVPSSFPGIPPTTVPTLPEIKQPSAQLPGILSNNIRTARGFHKRRGKMVLFEKAHFCGQAYDIYGDVADATALQFSPLISAKVIRGCWVLYEKPDFQGRLIALEEGGIELTNEWADSGLETDPDNQPMVIGSIRLAVSDYNIPHIDLFTEPEGHGRVTPYHEDAIETGSFGIPLSTASIRVHSGVWLVFSDPGFEGMLAVLDIGEYPYPETWGFPSPFIGSLRPLRMGGYKVENPNEVKVAMYEKPGFEGTCMEIDSEVFSFCDSEGGLEAEEANLDSKKLKSVGSLKVIGGLWVGYNQPGFEGQQYILEEGEYLDCNDWGGSELLSLRPILSDFMSPHLKMFSDRDFGELGVNIDVRVPLINMDDTGYGMKTQSIDVISGVWVVFEEPGFCGECYILEKGLYGSPEDWGALQPRIASVMPVVVDDFDTTAKFKVQLFSEPGFQGSVLALEDSVTSLQEGFSVASCKVLAGSWLAFEGQDFTSTMYVLEMGNYSDLRAMGCVSESSSILSLQPAGFEFSLPSITLFERCGLRGKRVVLRDGSVNLQLAGGCGRVQSVLVEGGIWILYEGINYRGAQMLLKPGEVLDWREISNWKRIGSLRPLLQRQVYFRLRNRQSGLVMSLTGDLDDIKLLRIQEMEETDGYEQIWYYQNGHIHCKLLEECCLSPSGSVIIAGGRAGVTPEQDNQEHLWSITPEGFIFYTPTSDLVLEVKGGNHYDKNQVILNTIDPNKLTQSWNVEII
ncbi:beta/gamma crystallin domain-containing protein 1-like [Scomber japonicus]|uniref:beta/gamma crystallin domain-containing protein 1-like n=1 Tax=Scomber japonicus TaxID=13676 RepID=UPI002304F18C|nr:beta/gamma crystallin domain-containing protein 1-like [Scomber japonicus]